MKNIALFLSCAALAHSFAASAGETAQSRAWVYEGEGIYSEADYLCDARDGSRMIAVLKPSQSVASMTQVMNRDFKRGKHVWTTLGEADAGMSQVRYALKNDGEGDDGYVHTISPGALGDPAKIAFPIVSSIHIDGTRSECRYNKDAEFLGIIEDRTVMVTRDENGGLHMLSWMTHSPGKAPEDIEGGKLLSKRDGVHVYRFEQGHSTITITAPANPDPMGAVILVEGDGGEKKRLFVRAYRTVIG